MRAAAANLEFEEAARLRDRDPTARTGELGLALEAKDGARGRSTAGRAGMSAREMVRAKVRARGKARRARA